VRPETDLIFGHSLHGVLGGKSSESRLNLHHEIVMIVFANIHSLGGVVHSPNNNGLHLDGVSYGIVAFDSAGLKVDQAQ
jgi:hypothetical protein